MASELNIDNEDILKQKKSGNQAEELFDELEEDDIPTHIREARLNEMKMRAREQMIIRQNKNDAYKEIREDEFLNLTTRSKKCIVHFFHPDFRRCDIMSSHLDKLAKKYAEVTIVKLNVNKAKFFVTKLAIQVLPAVMLFENGVLKHKIIGFDQLGQSDSFSTRTLEKKMWSLEFIKKPESEYDVASDAESDDEDERRGYKKTTSIVSKSDRYDYDSDE
jgi:thiol-disulfide isomerase/thioredoxin